MPTESAGTPRGAGALSQIESPEDQDWPAIAGAFFSFLSFFFFIFFLSRSRPSCPLAMGLSFLYSDISIIISQTRGYASLSRPGGPSLCRIASAAYCGGARVVPEECPEPQAHQEWLPETGGAMARSPHQRRMQTQ